MSNSMVMMTPQLAKYILQNESHTRTRVAAALRGDEQMVVPLLGRGGNVYDMQMLIDAQKRTMARAEEILAVNHTLQEQIAHAKTRADIYEARARFAEGRVKELERLTAVENPGNHDYHGPLGDDGVPAPDVIHERFHKAIGDVLAGSVMPKAREQMRDALNRGSPSLPPSGTTKDKPMPRGAIAFSHQQIGIRLP